MQPRADRRPGPAVEQALTAERPAATAAPRADPGPGTAELTTLTDRIAQAVGGTPGVARLAPGPAVTYLPGRTVPGVAVRDDAVEIDIVARYGASLPETAERVREAVRQVAPDRAVDVRVEDVE